MRVRRSSRRIHVRLGSWSGNWRHGVGRCVRMGGAGTVLVLAGPLLKLRLKHSAGDCCGVLEDEPAAVVCRNEENPHSSKRQDQRQSSLQRSHPALSHDSPQGKHPKDAERDEPQLLVGLHDTVNGLAMLDVVFGLKTGNDCGGSTDRAHDERPEAHLTKSWTPAHHADQLEEHSREQQRGGKVIECSVELRPTVAEHVSSSQESGVRSQESDLGLER